MTADITRRSGPPGGSPTPAVRILLDVDGVLNAVTRTPDPEQWDDWRKAECMGFSIRFSPTVGQRLGRLAAMEGVELRWLTTWEHHANEWICPLLDWPDHLVIDRHDIEAQRSGLLLATSGWWKFDEAKALYEADSVPFVWIDDDLGHGDDGASEWLSSLGSDNCLGISPSSHKGLTDRLLCAIERFVLARLDEEALSA